MTPMLKRVAFAGLMALVAAAVPAAPALAQARGDLLDTVLRDLALCAEIGDANARLACYDRVGDRAAGRQPRRVDGGQPGQPQGPSDNPADRAFDTGAPQPNYPAPGYGGPTQIIPGQGNQQGNQQGYQQGNQPGYQPPGNQAPGNQGYVPPPLPSGQYGSGQYGGQPGPNQPYTPPPNYPPPASAYQPGDPRALQPPPSSNFSGPNYPPPGSNYPPPGTAQPRDIGPPPGAGANPDAAFQPGAQPPPPPPNQRNARANPQPGELLPPVTFAIRQLRDRDYKWEVTVDVTNNTNRTVSQAVIACTLSQGQNRVGEYNAIARGIPAGGTAQAVAVGPETSRAYVDNATCRVLSPLP